MESGDAETESKPLTETETPEQAPKSEDAATEAVKKPAETTFGDAEADDLFGDLEEDEPAAEEAPMEEDKPAAGEAPMEDVDLFGASEEVAPDSPFDDLFDDEPEEKPQPPKEKPQPPKEKPQPPKEKPQPPKEKPPSPKEETPEPPAAPDAQEDKTINEQFEERAIKQSTAEQMVAKLTEQDDTVQVVSTSMDTMAEMVDKIKKEENATDARMKKMGFEEVANQPEADLFEEPEPKQMEDVSLDTPVSKPKAEEQFAEVNLNATSGQGTSGDDEKTGSAEVRAEFVQIISDQLGKRPGWRKNREKVFKSLKENVGCSDQEIQVAMQQLQAAYSFEEAGEEGDRVIRIKGTEKRGSNLSFTLGNLSYLVYVIVANPPVHEVETVYRRYNDFVWLRDTLRTQFPAMFVAPIPPKRIVKTEEFIQERRDDLERFLNRVARHHRLQDSKAFVSFLSSPESTFKQVKKQITEEVSGRGEAHSEKMKRLNAEFPEVERVPIDNILQDVQQMGEFFSRLKATSNVVSSYSTNLSQLHAELAQEMSLFAGLGVELNSIFNSCPFSEGCGQELFPAFDDISENLNRETDLVKHLFHYQNKYDVQDLDGILDGFGQWQNALKQADKIQAQASKKYRDPKKEGQELNTQQTIDRDALFEQEKNAIEYQRFLAKLLLKSEVPTLWKHRTRTYKATSRQFAKQQSQNYTKTEAAFRERLPPG